MGGELLPRPCLARPALRDRVGRDAEVRLPNDSVASWSPPAAAATGGVLTWLTASSFSPVPAAATAALEQGTISERPLSIVTSLIHVIPIDWTVMASPDNPILSLASLGFWLITGALASISSLAGVAVLNNTTRAIPLIGDALDVFAAAWPVLDGFVTLLLTTMLIAGLVLAYLLPAIPFIRFLFGILTWLITVIEALLAITIFLAAHVTREDSERLLTSSTRLAGSSCRPDPASGAHGVRTGPRLLRLQGRHRAPERNLVPLMQTSHAQASASPLAFLAMLAIYTIIAYGAATAAFKLIDLLPGHILTWIGGAAESTPAARRVSARSLPAPRRAPECVTPGSSAAWAPAAGRPAARRARGDLRDGDRSHEESATGTHRCRCRAVHAVGWWHLLPSTAPDWRVTVLGLFLVAGYAVFPPRTPARHVFLKLGVFTGLGIACAAELWFTVGIALAAGRLTISNLGHWGWSASRHGRR